MFREDKRFTHLDVHPDRVMVAKVGLNQVTIKVEQFPPQQAQAYVLGWYAARGSASIVTYLYCPSIMRSVAYRPEPAEFPMPKIQEFAEAATEFLESMGFMMDDIALASLPPDEQERWVERIPVFHADLRYYAESQGLDVESLEPEPVVEEVAPAQVVRNAPTQSARAVADLHTTPGYELELTEIEPVETIELLDEEEPLELPEIKPTAEEAARRKRMGRLLVSL